MVLSSLLLQAQYSNTGNARGGYSKISKDVELMDQGKPEDEDEPGSLGDNGAGGRMEGGVGGEGDGGPNILEMVSTDESGDEGDDTNSLGGDHESARAPAGMDSDEYGDLEAIPLGKNTED